MKIKRLWVALVGGVAATCVIVSVSSAQSAYRERVFIQRQSLLGSVFRNFTIWLSNITSAPDQAPAPYSMPATNEAGPVASGFNQWRAPVRRGGGCSACSDGSAPDNGNCPDSGGASCSGNTITRRECVDDDDQICTSDESCVLDCTSSIRRDQKKYCRETACIRPCTIICLASTSKIATPRGESSITDLKVGDIVWTADAAGNRVVRSLLRVSRVPVINHHVVHLALADGRTLDVSALHPTADGRTVGDLKAGEVYDGSVVQSVILKPYKGSATYDILPAGDTGYYWANGILMGSTLK